MVKPPGLLGFINVTPPCCSFINIKPQSDTNSQWLKPQTTSLYKQTDPSADLSKTNHEWSVCGTAAGSVMLTDKITYNRNLKDVHSMPCTKLLLLFYPKILMRYNIYNRKLPFPVHPEEIFKITYFASLFLQQKMHDKPIYLVYLLLYRIKATGKQTLSIQRIMKKLHHSNHKSLLSTDNRN